MGIIGVNFEVTVLGRGVSLKQLSGVSGQWFVFEGMSENDLCGFEGRTTR